MSAKTFQSRLPIVREQSGIFYRRIDVSGCLGIFKWVPFEATFARLREASATMMLIGVHGEKLGIHENSSDYFHLLHSIIDPLHGARQACQDYAVGPDTPLRIEVRAKVVDRPVILDRRRQVTTIPTSAPNYVDLTDLEWIEATAEEISVWDLASAAQAGHGDPPDLPPLTRIDDQTIVEQVIWNSRNGVTIDDQFDAVVTFLAKALADVPPEPAQVAADAVRKLFPNDKRLTA